MKQEVWWSKTNKNGLSSRNWMMGPFTGTPILFDGQNLGFRWRFSLKPIHWYGVSTAMGVAQNGWFISGKIHPHFIPIFRGEITNLSPFSHGFPRVFPGFSHGFAMVIPGVRRDFAPGPHHLRPLRRFVRPGLGLRYSGAHGADQRRTGRMPWGVQWGDQGGVENHGKYDGTWWKYDRKCHGKWWTMEFTQF